MSADTETGKKVGFRSSHERGREEWGEGNGGEYDWGSRPTRDGESEVWERRDLARQGIDLQALRSNRGWKLRHDFFLFPEAGVQAHTTPGGSQPPQSTAIPHWLISYRS